MPETHRTLQQWLAKWTRFAPVSASTAWLWLAIGGCSPRLEFASILRRPGSTGISALKTRDIRKLLKESADGASAPLDPEALVPDAVAEVISPDFPGERLMVCLNPRLQQERRRKREALLQATEDVLAGIAAAAARGKPGPANRDRTIKALGRLANRRKMEKHFDFTISDSGMDWSRNQDRIEQEARLDGVYVVRTSLDSEAIGSEAAVEAYKSLAGVERAFRTLKVSRLEVRPIHVYSEDHVRAHLFLCMLACYVEWHMRRRLASLLFEDDDREGGRGAAGLSGEAGKGIGKCQGEGQHQAHSRRDAGPQFQHNACRPRHGDTE